MIDIFYMPAFSNPPSKSQIITEVERVSEKWTESSNGRLWLLTLLILKEVLSGTAG
jgi:hypothetical protein